MVAHVHELRVRQHVHAAVRDRGNEVLPAVNDGRKTREAVHAVDVQEHVENGGRDEEHTDLAAAMPDVARAMGKRLDELAKSFFENHDDAPDSCPSGVVPPGVPCACWMAVHRYGGVMGPFQEITF